MNETLHIAIEYDHPVIFTIWTDGFFDEIEGSIRYIDQVTKRVHVVDIRGHVQTIDFDMITEVEYAQ